MPIVRMLQGPVRYSSTNGINTTEYDKDKFYEVPPHVASGMVARGWAEVVEASQLAASDGPARAAPQQVPQPAPTKSPTPPPTPPTPKRDDDNGEEENEDEAAHARGGRKRGKS